MAQIVLYDRRNARTADLHATWRGMTMPRIVSAGITTTVIIVCLAISSPAVAGEGKVYGEPLSGKETIKISALMANPEEHVGQTVKVEGLITAVCEKRGCWMSLASDEEFQELRIKVDDGVIVFPLEAKGKHALAEGEFTRIEMTMEQTIAYKKHHAEEHGEEFDPSTVTEPLTYYQIKATGAVIR